MKKQKGITLIALVITIIVLLILAAVSIATLTGENGILTRANTSKEVTQKGEAEDRLKLLANEWKIESRTGSKDLETFLTEKQASGEIDSFSNNGDGSFTITIGDYEGTITDSGDLNGELGKVQPPIEFTNIKTDETNPNGNMPKDATALETDGSKGIAVKDQNDNEWVWIEVPKSIYKSAEYNGGQEPSGATDYDKITKVLKTYADPYTKGSADQIENSDYNNWKDEWYDKLGTSYDGVNEYSQVNYADNETRFGEAKTYYGTIYTDQGTTPAESYSSGETYYAKITDKLEDIAGCGLTYSEYKSTYEGMLKSIYTNGGFWIGRYEAGIEGTTESAEEKPNILTLGRTETSSRINDSSPKAICQKDAIPYNCVYCSEAEILSKAMSENTRRTTSLMFGVQWDLVCKFLEMKGVPTDQINSNSGTLGNYVDSAVPIDSEKAKKFSGSTKNWQTINGTKEKNTTILLSTGSAEYTDKLNIYDFAGNEWEWTLEHATANANEPCSIRGGNFYYGASSYPASYRICSPATYSSSHNSFRPALW